MPMGLGPGPGGAWTSGLQVRGGSFFPLNGCVTNDEEPRSDSGAGWAGPSRVIFLRAKTRDAARSARRGGGWTQACGGRRRGRGGSRGGALPETSRGGVGTLQCRGRHPCGRAEPRSPRGRLGARRGWDRGAHARSPV